MDFPVVLVAISVLFATLHYLVIIVLIIISLLFLNAEMWISQLYFFPRAVFASCACCCFCFHHYFVLILSCSHYLRWRQQLWYSFLAHAVYYRHAAIEKTPLLKVTLQKPLWNQSIEHTDCFCVKQVLHKTLYIRTGEEKRIFVIWG